MNKKFLVWMGLILVLLGSFRIANIRAMSFHFVDEEDHIVTADFMNQGLKLYKDLSVNHQPLVYLSSQALQTVTQPNSIYVLIKTHRLAMFVYGALWSVILVWRFGLVGLLFSLVMEGLKYYGFGNLWLMESMAIYPSVYILGRMIEGFWSSIWPKKWETIMIGFSSFLVLFNLVPLWPWLAVVWLVYLIKDRKMFGWQLLGLLVPTVILFLFISPIDWFRETIEYNVVYAMPQLSVINTFQDWLKIIFFPFVAFTMKGSYVAKIFGYLFIGLVTASVIRKKYWLLGLVYGLLILANLRVPSPTEVYYSGFHLLPWMGMLLISSLLMISKIKNKQIVFVLAIWGLGLFLNKNMPYFWQTNSMAEYQVNFARFGSLNNTVKSLAKPNDRMAVLTSESLIYWQTGVKPATRQVVYYAWEHEVPRLKEEYEQVFYGANPPEFIYGANETRLVEEKYKQVWQDETETELYIKIEKNEK
jgi:hypothetical protein